MFSFFQKDLNLEVRTNKLVNSVYCPFPSILVLGYILKLFRVLSLSRTLLEFSLTCWKKISIYGVRIRKSIESMDFYSCSSSPLKTPRRIFWNLFPPRTKNKRVEETMICFIKIQSENMKMNWNINLFIFCMIYNSCKCDVFTVLWIISIR